VDLSDCDITVVTGARTEGKEGTARGAGVGVMGKILDFKQRRQQRAAVGGWTDMCKVAVCSI